MAVAIEEPFWVEVLQEREAFRHAGLRLVVEKRREAGDNPEQGREADAQSGPALRPNLSQTGGEEIQCEHEITLLQGEHAATTGGPELVGKQQKRNRCAMTEGDVVVGLGPGGLMFCAVTWSGTRSCIDNVVDDHEKTLVS